MKQLLKISILASALLAGANAQVINLNEGWNNIGITADASIHDFDNENIRVMWQFSDNGWSVYTPNMEMMNAISQDIQNGNVNYELIPSSMRAGSALWVYANTPTTLRVGEQAVFTSIFGVVKDSMTQNVIDDFNISIDGNPATGFEENGTFNISSLSLGEHTMVISADGYRDLNMSLDLESAVPQNLGQIYLMPDTAVTNINLNGRVMNALNGEGISGARFRLFNGYNNENGEAVVDTVLVDGEFDLNITAGAYTVVIDANGYYSTSYNYTFTSNEENGSVTQDFALAPQTDSNEEVVLRSILTWGGNEPDLDSHLVAYNTNTQTVDWNVYYADRTGYATYTTENNTTENNTTENNTTENNTSNIVAQLDRDDTDYYGPETITLSSLNTNETYKYFVYNYSDFHSLKDSEAHLSVFFNGREYEFQVPNEEGNVWKVFEIRNGVLIPCVENCMLDASYGGTLNYEQASTLRTLNSSDSKSLNAIINDYITNPK